MVSKLIFCLYLIMWWSWHLTCETKNLISLLFYNFPSNLKEIHSYILELTRNKSCVRFTNKDLICLRRIKPSHSVVVIRNSWQHLFLECINYTVRPTLAHVTLYGVSWPTTVWVSPLHITSSKSMILWLNILV